jgi:hypothetical protein
VTAHGDEDLWEHAGGNFGLALTHLDAELGTGVAKRALEASFPGVKAGRPASLALARGIAHALRFREGAVPDVPGMTPGVRRRVEKGFAFLDRIAGKAPAAKRDHDPALPRRVGSEADEGATASREP